MCKSVENRLILDEDSSVESKQYTEEQDDMGQYEQGHNDNGTEIEENQDEVQEKHDDGNEET